MLAALTFIALTPLIGVAAEKEGKDETEKEKGKKGKDGEKVRSSLRAKALGARQK